MLKCQKVTVKCQKNSRGWGLLYVMYTVRWEQSRWLDRSIRCRYRAIQIYFFLSPWNSRIWSGMVDPEKCWEDSVWKPCHFAVVVCYSLFSELCSAFFYRFRIQISIQFYRGPFLDLNRIGYGSGYETVFWIFFPFFARKPETYRPIQPSGLLSAIRRIVSCAYKTHFIR